jgi:hypothetical protein
MFIDEFVFSFSLLLFTGGLLLLGVLILIDASRRFVRPWWSKPSSEKNRGVVLHVDIPRPVANSIRDDTRDLVQRPLSIPDNKVA